MAEHIKLFNPDGTESTKQANIVDVDGLTESDDLEGYGLSVVGNTIKKINFTAVKNAFVTAINTATSSMNTLYQTVNSWYSEISSSWTTWFGGVQDEWDELSDDVEEATENANTQAEAARQAAADRTVPQLTDIADSSYDSNEKILSIVGTVIKKMTPTGLFNFILSKITPTDFVSTDYIVGANSNMQSKVGSVQSLANSGFFCQTNRMYLYAASSNKYWLLFSTTYRYRLVTAVVNVQGYLHNASYLVSLCYNTEQDKVLSKVKIGGSDVTFYVKQVDNTLQVYVKGYGTDTNVMLSILTRFGAYPTLDSQDTPPYIDEADFTYDYTI